MELRSRSRSNTPLRTSESSSVVVENNHSHTSSTNSRVLRSKKLRTVSEITEESVTMKTTSNSNHKSSKSTKLKDSNFTSDYSSEDGEHDLSHTENNVNHALEFKQEFQKQKRSKNEFIALKMYRDAKEYWNLYPKTDYTYSPHSKDRVEIAPGVVNMPNMSRRSIHTGDSVDFVHKETNTNFSQSTTRRGLVPRMLFGDSSNNNEEYLSFKQSSYSSSTSSTVVEISIFRRIFYSVFYVLYMSSRPLVMTHNVIVQAFSRAHRFASKVMMLDAWLLRGTSHVGTEESSRLRSKWINVLALCLLPLLFFGGIWLLSTLGQALAAIIAASSDKLTTASTASPLQTEPLTAGLLPTQPTETVIKIQLDSPYRAGLSATQMKQIAESLKQNLNLDLDVDTIMKVLLVDPNVQRLDESKPADIAAALTNEQIVSITRNLNQFQYESIDNIVQKVLETDQISAQEKLIKELYSQIEKLRVDLKAAVMSNSANFLHLSNSIKRCCRLNALQMERYINNLIAAILNSKEHKDNLAQWLGTLFVAQNELEVKLHNATEKLNKRFDDLIKDSAQKIMEDVSLKLADRVSNANLQLDSSSRMPPDEIQIRAIVKSALATYDADKTGLVDYALESAGGQILSTRCTEHYSAGTSVVSIFGVPLWYPSTSPRTVITPGVVPGECWAFQSFPGFVIVKLSHNVTISAFSYEHVSRFLIPSGRVDSAPKNFQVFGLDSLTVKEPVLLGEFQYDALGDALQFFPVSDTNVLSRSFQIVELKVNSNHGNPNYTCLYRFRVHGKIAT